MLPPQHVDGSQVVGGDELHLGEEHVPALHGGVAGEGDEEAPRLLVGLPEVFGGEVLLEELQGGVLGGGGVGCGGGECGGGGGEGGGVGLGEGGGGGAGGWSEEDGVCGGGRAIYRVAPPEGAVVVVYGVESVGRHFFL